MKTAEEWMPEFFDEDVGIRDGQMVQLIREVQRDALEAAANWCAQQANALYKLKRDDEQRKAFVESANAIRKIAGYIGKEQP